MIIILFFVVYWYDFWWIVFSLFLILDFRWCGRLFLFWVVFNVVWVFFVFNGGLYWNLLRILNFILFLLLFLVSELKVENIGVLFFDGDFE